MNDWTTGKAFFHQMLAPPCTHFRTQIERRSPPIAVWFCNLELRSWIFGFLWRAHAVIARDCVHVRLNLHQTFLEKTCVLGMAPSFTRHGAQRAIDIPVDSKSGVWRNIIHCARSRTKLHAVFTDISLCRMQVSSFSRKVWWRFKSCCDCWKI
jgi:hypothetical protein